MEQLIPLSEINESVKVSIDAMKVSSQLQVRLLAMGLGLGSLIQILRNRQGDVVLSRGHCRIGLGKNIAQQLLVKEL